MFQLTTFSQSLRRSSRIVVLSLPLWSCGGGGGDDRSGNAPNPASPAPVLPPSDTGDTTSRPEAVVTLDASLTAPEKISITPVFRITFDKPVDRSSIDNTTATLTPVSAPLNRSGSSVPLQITVDDDLLSLRIIPETALQDGHRYRLSLREIQDIDGNAIAARDYELTTYRNRIDRREMFGFGESGQYEMVRLEQYRYSNGSLTQIVIYGSAGGDGQWQTPDDEISAYTRFHRETPDRETAITYFDPGPDQVWETQDDRIDNITLTRFDADAVPEERTTYIDPGPDGIWQTSDDLPEAQILFDRLGRENEKYEFSYSILAGALIPSGYLHTSFDRENNVVTEISAGAGQDNQFLTTDDVVFSFRRDMITDSLTLVPADRIISALSWHPGADGQWLTQDDDLSSYSRIQDISEKKVATIYQYTSPGEDGLWFTDDDPIAGVSLRQSRADAEVGSIDLPTYIDAGGDGQWLSGDDTVGDYTEHQFDIYDQTHIFTTRYYTGPGEDGLWFNDDDVIRSWSREVSNSYGQITEKEIFAHTSARSGIVTHRLSLYDYDEQGNLRMVTRKRDPGDDGIWNTEDDQLDDITYYFAD